MKKRLRKKKHVAELAERGRQPVIMRNRKEGFDDFLDAFIEEAIESNGCYCGGGGKEDKLDVVVELGRRSDDPDARANRITAGLDSRSDVGTWRLGEEERISCYALPGFCNTPARMPPATRSTSMVVKTAR
jgi:uncharacterized protein YggL (DUF469 family)